MSIKLILSIPQTPLFIAFAGAKKILARVFRGRVAESATHQNSRKKSDYIGQKSGILGSEDKNSRNSSDYIGLFSGKISGLGLGLILFGYAERLPNKHAF